MRRFQLTSVQFIEEHCQLRAGSGAPTIMHRKPDKLSFLKTYVNARRALTLSLVSTEDKQVTGEIILIQYMLYLFPQAVEGFTHICHTGNQPDLYSG